MHTFSKYKCLYHSSWHEQTRGLFWKKWSSSMQPLLHSLNTRQGNFQSTSFSCPDLCNHNNPDHLECGQYFLQKYKQPQTWSIRMLMALKHCQPIFIDWWPTILDCNKLCKKEECHLVVRQSSQDQEFCFSRHSFKIGHPNTPPLLH